MQSICGCASMQVPDSAQTVCHRAWQRIARRAEQENV
jgi:hypothetical protein